MPALLVDNPPMAAPIARLMLRVAARTADERTQARALCKEGAALFEAGTSGPNPLEPTFGPEATPRDSRPDRNPLDGFESFGTGSIDPKSRAPTMRLHDVQGVVVHGLELGPH